MASIEWTEFLPIVNGPGQFDVMLGFFDHQTKPFMVGISMHRCGTKKDAGPHEVQLRIKRMGWINPKELALHGEVRQADTRIMLDLPEGPLRRFEATYDLRDRKGWIKFTP